MYPAQTSLIPAQIALAKFLEAQGLGAFLSDYPYWYLGSTPFKYLTGPILPSLLVLIHKIFPYATLFNIYYLIIIICWFIAGFGTYLLIKELNGGRTVRLLGSLFFLFGPVVPFLFRFNDGLYLVAFSFLPFTLVFYQKLMKKWSVRIFLIAVFLLSLEMLIDTLIIPTLALGMTVILLTFNNWERVEERIKQSLLLFAVSILIATWWYSPGYWSTLIFGPSWAGKGLLEVFGLLAKLIPSIFAFIIAIFAVKFFPKRNSLRDFCFYWLTVFGLLTVIRFLSDPDFWLDWTAYGLEIQFGAAVILGLIFAKISGLKLKIILSVLYFLFYIFVFNKYLLGTMQKDINSSVEYRIASQLNKTVKPGQRVFLSGTTVFWLNAFFDIAQVRGGVDQVSVDPNWRVFVWEIREGESPREALEALRKLGVDYLVVHDKTSEEFYHDFANPDKFAELPVLQKIYDQQGDRIYKLSDK